MPAEPAEPASRASPAVVEARGLEAVLRSGDGVGPVDLVIAAGERVLLLGPSGSGKSTLLRLLHGAIPHAIHADVRGEVRVAGRLIADTRVADLADVVGVVAQDPESGVCLPGVADEVAFPLENMGVDAAAIGDAVDLALRRAAAEVLRDRETSELSGGELQRIALAAAIVTSPRLLLLDEPTAMLDADGVDAVRAAVDSAVSASGAACVLVEHRLDELAGDGGLDALPERWLVLDRDGRVLHDALARDLSTAALRDLVAQGCWLPLDLELRAVLDRDARGEPTSLAPEAGGGSTPGDDAFGDRVDGMLDELFAELRDGSDAKMRTATAPRTERRAFSGGATCAYETLTARGLSVGRGPRGRRHTVLREIDLVLRPGETVALVGANGSGKSTLLACLAGLEPPTSGAVEGPRAGLVFQNPEHQFAAASVRAELAHGLALAAAHRIGGMLRDFGLEGLEDHNPHRLSGGQKRRVSLAAMLLHDRPFLLADEPAFGLDRHAQIGAMRSLRAAAHDGRGVLFSSHDLRAVTAYADRVLVVGDGALLADTTPMGLLRDQTLLHRARLRAPRILRRLAEHTLDDAEGRSILSALDDRALALRANRHQAVSA